MPNGNATTDDSWRASGRPVSTIARSFSAALDEAFFAKPDLDNLSQSVAQKQQSVSTQKSELEELEARLRETEARLKTQQASDSSSTSPALKISEMRGGQEAMETGQANRDFNDAAMGLREKSRAKA